MAPKLALLALFAALLVIADATIVRTTITTTEIEEDNPHGGSSQQQQCSREIQGKRFNKCQQYLTRSSSRPYDILRVVDVNPLSQEQEKLEECCNELKELRNPQCACEALKKIVREETQQGSSRYEGQGQQGEGRQMLQKAKMIPQQCRIPIGSCRFQEY